MAIIEILIWFFLAGFVLVAVTYLVERARPVRPLDQRAKFAGARGRRTHYRWHGREGAPVAVCVHGLTTPSYVWDAFVPILAGLGYRVLVYDLFGRGLSDTPKGAQSSTYFAEQLDELLDELQVKDPILLAGYSMGGAITATYAATRPSRLKTLVLIAPAGFGHDLGWVPRLAGRLSFLGSLLMRLAYPYFARSALAGEADIPCAVENMIARQTEETRWRRFAPVVWSSIRGVLSEDLSHHHQCIAKAGIPTLAIWGEEDSVIPLTGLERLRALNPGAKNTVISGAGHGLTYTHIHDLQEACRPLELH